MLVLSRKAQESLRIGEDVIVQVVSIVGDRVRLGVIAPKKIQVDREEVHERKKRDARRAARKASA